MTEQKAIDYFNNVIIDTSIGLENMTITTELINISIKALKKQIPKKSIHYHHCPSCENGLPAEKITDEYCSCCFKWDYCPKCGQRLEWG